MRLAILGATGSVGTTAIKAIRSGLIDCTVAALVSCASSLDELSSEFSSPALVAAGRSDEEIRSFIASSSPDIILNAVSGTAGLKYTLMAIEEGIDIALANKAIFFRDMKQCREITLRQWKQRPLHSKLGQSIMQLFAPIL